MKLNKRKSITLKNRTNYFDPNSSRTHVRFTSPYSYQSRVQKIEGYETRLYWEYKYCEDHNGQTFFYTLTYNDAHIPQFEGQNCFDYEDLVYLLNGGFKKQLLRKYGTNFKYFVGAELGDGKGKRGMHNNPHYHVLFFLRNADDSRYPYKKISPLDFRHLVRKYWQGFDEDRDGYRPYNEAKLGIAKEGENFGLVTDFRACMYCAKYVSKDVALKRKEDQLISKLILKYSKQLFSANDTKEDFFYEVINPKFNIPTKPHLDSNHKDWLWSLPQLYSQICPKSFEKYGIQDDFTLYDKMIDECNLRTDYKEYVDAKVNEIVKEKVNLYRNRYCNKCRISQGVGDYALKFISDPLNPSVKVPSKDGWKPRPIGLYYYRKLFTEVVKDSENQPVRLLNDLGIRYKVNRLPKQIKRLEDKTLANVNALTPDLYAQMIQSDVNADVNVSYDRFINLLNDGELRRRLFRTYAVYKLVYEDRYFKIITDSNTGNCDFPRIDIIDDYKRFLKPSYYTVARCPFGVDHFMESDCEGYLPYYSHPAFLRYVSIFAVFDLLSDYLFVQMDEKAQFDAEEIAKTKRFHDKERLKQFYSNFI